MMNSRSVVLFLLFCLYVPSAHAQAVNVWLTSDDQQSKMSPQPALEFEKSQKAPASQVIEINESRRYQKITGFGASFTDSAAYLLNEIAQPAQREQAMKDLFTRVGRGIGVSFVRNPMGASDLARFHYSYDDLPAGQTDPKLEHFSIEHDRKDIIPLMKQALRLNPSLKVMANPWSPPGWMKTSGGMIGGELLPNMYRPFAEYFVKYIQGYGAEGIPIHYISLQNEPLYVPKDYPGMSLPPEIEAGVLKQYLIPALAAEHIKSRVLIYDHNWDQPDYPEAILVDPALANSEYVAGTAWHGYGGSPDAMSQVHDKYPEKETQLTEHSGGTWVKDQVKQDFEDIIGSLRNWSQSYIKWSLALDENRGPHAGGCGTCTPLVWVNSKTGAVSYAIDYFTLGHFSKFIVQGAERVKSDGPKELLNVAFVNPDGSRALVVFNDSDSNEKFVVNWRGKSFEYSLAALAGATFVWRGETGSHEGHKGHTKESGPTKSVD